MFNEHFCCYPELFSQLAASADEQDITVVLPDVELKFPILWKSDVHLRENLSKYFPWSFPEGLPQVQVVRKPVVTPGEVAQSWRLLGELNHPLAPYLSGRIKGALEQQQ